MLPTQSYARALPLYIRIIIISLQINSNNRNNYVNYMQKEITTILSLLLEISLYLFEINNAFALFIRI